MDHRKIEQWWTGDYPGLSIKNYKKMSVYFLFLKNRKPFLRETKKYREAFWIDDNCEIYEWFDLTNRTGEKFGHDHYSDTKFYEYWWVIQPDNIRKVRKVWLCEPVEWGVEITYYPDHEDWHGWSVNNGKVVLEDKKKFPDHSEGVRFGTVDTEDGPEDFEENFWEDSDKNRVEKVWKNPLGHGKKNNEEEGKRIQGSKEEVNGDHLFRENWDKDSDRSFEDENHQVPGEKWGKLRNRRGKKQVKVEWTGEKPLLTDPNSIDDLAELAKESFKTLEKVDGISNGKPRQDDLDETCPEDLLDLLKLLSHLPGSPEDQEKIQKALKGLARRSKRNERSNKPEGVERSLSKEPLDERQEFQGLGLEGKHFVEPAAEIEAAIRENIRNDLDKFIQGLIDLEKEKQEKLNGIDKNNLQGKVGGEGPGKIDEILKLLAQVEGEKLSQLSKLAEFSESLSPKNLPSEPFDSATEKISDPSESFPPSSQVPSDAPEASKSGEQDLKNALSELESESTRLFPLLSSSSANLPEVLSDFSNLDDKANRLADDLLKDLAGNFLQVNVWVTLGQGDFWDLLKSVDSKSSDLLAKNLEKTKNLAKNDLSPFFENFEKAVEEAEKMPTDSPVAYLQKVSKRLDLLQDLEGLAADLLEKQAKVIEELNKQLREGKINDQGIEDLRDQLSQALKRADDLAKENQLLNNSQDLQGIIKAREELKDLQDKLNAQEKELKSRENELKTRESGLDDKQADLSSKESALNAKESDLAAKDSDLASKEANLNSTSSDIGSLQDALNQKDQDLKSLQDHQKSLEKQLKDQEEKLDDQAKLMSNSSEDLSKLLEQLRNDLKEKDQMLQNKESELAKQANELNDKLKELNEKQQELNEKDQKFKELSDLKESLEAEQAGLKDQLNDLQGALKSKTEELLNKEFDLKTLENELRDKDAELADKNDELEAKKQALNATTKSLENAENEIKLKNVELFDKSKNLEKLAEDLKKASENLEESQENAKKIQEDLAGKAQELEKTLDDQEKLKKMNQAQLEQLDLQKKMMESSDQNSELLQKLAEDSGNKAKELAEALAELEALKRAQKNSDSAKQDLESSLNSANDELSALKKAFEDLKEAQRKCQLRSVFKIFEGNQRKLFKKWLDRTKNPEKAKEILGFTDESLLMSDEEEEKQFVQEYKAADDMLHEENKMLVETNVIMQNYKQIEGKTDKPMSYINIFKFLEELISNKYETDKKDTADRRQMRTMTEFMMESLQRKFGIQSLALKFLGQFIPGFFQLFNEGHKYAVFFARLLQLFHSEPVSYSLALYLVRVAIEFNGLVEKCERFFSNFKITANSKEGTHGRKAYEEASTGGIALVSDVIDYIYTIFAGDRESGTKALELMKPEVIGADEYVIFRICHKMAKLGSTPESIFNTLDKDGGGSISSKELVTGLKRDLDLWVSEANINKLMESMDSDGTGDLSREEFMMRINMKTFAEWTKKPVWTISKCSFLIAMIEVFKHNQRKLAAHLSPKFMKFGKPQLDKEEFEELLLEYEPSLSVYDIEKLFNEGLESTPGAVGISFKAVALLMSKYGLGYLKSFKIKELLDTFSSRKTIVDISLNAPEPGTHKKVKSSISITSEEVKRDKNRLSVGTPNDTSKTPRTFSERVESPGRISSTPKEGLAKKKSVAEETKKSSIGLPPLPDVDKSPSMVRKKSVKK